MIDGNNQMAEALKGIKDVETAKAAAPKLQAAVDALKAAGKTMETMEEPSEAIKKRMETEFGPAVEKAQAAITAEMVRLAQLPDALKIIQPAIDSMDK